MAKSNRAARIALSPLATFLCALCVLCGEQSRPASAAEDELPRFRVHTASGKNQAGILKKIGERWSVLLLEGDDFTRTNADDLVSIRRAESALPGAPAGAFVILANGDLLPLLSDARPTLGGEQITVDVDLGFRAELKLPLSAVRAIWITAREGSERPDKFRRTLATAKRSRDAIYLRNGDVVEGVLTALDPKQLEVEVDKKEVTIETGKVAAIALNTDLIRFTPPKEPQGRFVLANGARLTLSSARCDGKTVSGKTSFGGDVHFPLTDVVALNLLGGPAVYLSDLKPAKYEFKSFLGNLHYPLVLDANANDGDLRLGGSVYDKGLGTHAAARITYTLAGAYRRFEAKVGLDGRAAAGAAARIRVLVDGKAPDKGATLDLTRRDGGHSLAVDVREANELTLLVEFLPGLVPGDVNWADARLIKVDKK
jgi:hypothetical protein